MDVKGLGGKERKGSTVAAERKGYSERKKKATRNAQKNMKWAIKVVAPWGWEKRGDRFAAPL